jgi:hypothetical protein
MENLEALEIEKNILNPLRYHFKVMMYEYIFVYIVLPLIIIIKIIDFFVGNIFSIFFSCTFKNPR